MKLIKHRHTWQLATLIIADLAVFCATDTRTTASTVLILGFLLFSATIYQLFKGLMLLLGMYGIHLKHQKRFVTAATTVVSGMVALQSIGQLGSKDVIVICIMALLFYLYVTYARANERTLVAKKI